MGQRRTCVQHAESESDDFGTMITEVIPVTTRKRLRAVLDEVSLVLSACSVKTHLHVISLLAIV